MERILLMLPADHGIFFSFDILFSQTIRRREGKVRRKNHQKDIMKENSCPKEKKIPWEGEFTFRSDS